MRSEVSCFTFIVDLSVSIDVGLPDHLIDLLVGQLLSQIGHDVSEFCRRDEPVSVLVEDPEGLPNLLLGIRVLHLPGHHGQELGEVDGAVAVGVHLVDHVLQLGLGGVLPQGAHDGAQLLGGDGAVAVLVEQGKGFFEFGDLLFCQLIGLKKEEETINIRSNSIFPTGGKSLKR